MTVSHDITLFNVNENQQHDSNFYSKILITRRSVFATGLVLKPSQTRVTLEMAKKVHRFNKLYTIRYYCRGEKFFRQHLCSKVKHFSYYFIFNNKKTSVFVCIRCIAYARAYESLFYLLTFFSVSHYKRKTFYVNCKVEVENQRDDFGSDFVHFCWQCFG